MSESPVPLTLHAASTRLHALAREMQQLFDEQRNPCETLAEAIKAAANDTLT